MKELKSTYYKTLLKRFDTYIIATKSIKTGNYYTGNVRDFFLYLEEREIFSLGGVSEKTMKEYLDFLVTRKKQRGNGLLSTRTINCNLSTLRMFSIRMQKEGVLKRGLPVPENFEEEKNENNCFALTRSVLTTDEIKLIYKATKNNFEKSLIALAYGCGLRRSALVNLQDSDINYAKGILTVRGAKNNKTRQVPVSDFFLIPLRNYNIERLHIMRKANSTQKHFFIDPSSKPYSGERLNKTLKGLIDRTGNQTLKEKNITLHCLRHSIATHLMDAGESFEYVRDFLGHSMVDTTTIYARNRKIKNYYTV
jgi:site-specific recombinase XerD